MMAAPCCIGAEGVKVTVTVALLLPATRSAVAISIETDVARAVMAPEDTARLVAMSADVCTVTHALQPAVAAPIVSPRIVMVTDLSSTGGPAASPAMIITSELLEVGWNVRLRSTTLLADPEGVTSGAKNSVG